MPPTLIGTLVGTLIGTLYVIFDFNNLKLWTPVVRSVVVGGAALVLATYSVSLTLLENDEQFKEHIRTAPKSEYWLRVMSQVMLALSLASIGVNLGYYFVLFALFATFSFAWTFHATRVASIESLRRVIGYDAANMLLCLIYSALALHMYYIAAEFESSYAVFSIDPASFRNRLEHLRGKVQDVLIILALIVGAILANLVVLVTRSGWIRREPRP